MFPRLALLATLLCGTLSAEDYRFSFEGRDYDPAILPVLGERKGASVAGDIGRVADFPFVLGKPGHYQFRVGGREGTQLFCKIDQGPEHCVGAKVVRDGILLSSPAHNPVLTLSQNERNHLRSIRVQDTDLIEDWHQTFAGVDWSRCALVIDLSGPNRPFPELPKDIRYLEFDSVTRSQKLAGLEKLTELNYFRVTRIHKFDLSLLSKARKLRNLDLEGYSVQNAESLAHLTALRFLKLRRLRGFESIAFVKEMPHLRVFKVDRTEVADLRPLESCPDLRLVSANRTRTEHLPAGNKLPALREIRLLATPVAEQKAPLAALAQDAPDCAVLTDWQNALVTKLGKIDRLRIRSGGTKSRELDKEKTLFEIVDVGKIEALINSIALTERPLRPAECTCSGEPTFEFYRDQKLIAMIGYHHNEFLHWHKGVWPTDATITLACGELFAELLADEGYREPLKHLVAYKARARHVKRHLEALVALSSEAWLRAAGEAMRNILRGKGFKIGPDLDELIEKRWPAELERAAKVFSMYGAIPDAFWDESLGLDFGLQQSGVLTQASTQIPALLLKQQTNPQIMNGISRWALADIGVRLEGKNLTLISQWALADPRAANRVRVLLTLDQNNAEAQLLAFLKNPPPLRKLPTGALEAAEQIKIDSPLDADQQLVARDREIAALLLAKRNSRKARPIIEDLLTEAPEDARQFYQAALTHLREIRGN